MDTNVTHLAAWLKHCAKEHPKDFPRADQDYYKRYEAVENYLNTEVHPNVEKMAIIKDGGLLTDHGPEHIRTVINRASDLLGDPSNKITGYEAYILLLAIHFHDVGNFYGRDFHEEKNIEIMEKCKTLMGDDSIERRIIQQIAEAHGGKEKDKISKLNADEPLNNKKVRMQRLAAVLRFADELADDKNRANRFILESGMIPVSSEVYHSYAFHLHTVNVNPGDRVVDLVFAFTEELAMKKLGKRSEKVYLLDEIYERTMKAHLERTYCMRFMRDVAPIEKINVTIDVFDKHYRNKLSTIAYQLKESGYPDHPTKDILRICPDLRHESGAKLKRYLKAQHRN